MFYPLRSKNAIGQVELKQLAALLFHIIYFRLVKNIYNTVKLNT